MIFALGLLLFFVCSVVIYAYFADVVRSAAVAVVAVLGGFAGALMMVLSLSMFLSEYLP